MAGQAEVAEDAGGQDPGRHRRGHAHPLVRQRRTGINGGPPGDLYVEVHIKPHAVFERDGDDLHCQMPISFATAALGGDTEVPTLGGKATFRCPKAQASKTFRLRGKGIRGALGYPGDLYVHVAVETPVKLTEAQKDMLRQFDRSVHEGGSRHSPQEQSGWTR